MVDWAAMDTEIRYTIEDTSQEIFEKEYLCTFVQEEPHITLTKKYIDRFHTLNVYPKQNKEGSTEHSHLLWMLNQILENEDQSITKKHRWLGFIQGCMVCDGLLSIENERNETRSLLNGK